MWFFPPCFFWVPSTNTLKIFLPLMMSYISHLLAILLLHSNLEFVRGFFQYKSNWEDSVYITPNYWTFSDLSKTHPKLQYGLKGIDEARKNILYKNQTYVCVCKISWLKICLQKKVHYSFLSCERINKLFKILMVLLEIIQI